MFDKFLINTLGITAAVALIIALLWVIVFLGGGIVSMVNDSRPSRQVPPSVLVGFGCEGQSPTVVATEEDLMPRCISIDVHHVAGAR